MTTDLERQLTTSLTEHTAGVSLTTDVLGAAKRRHSRRTALFRTTYATAALAAMAIVTVTVYPKQTQTPVALSPAAQLSAAGAASDNTSYQLAITVQWTKAGQSTGQLQFQGAFDPATTTGYVTGPAGSRAFEQRLINGTRYTKGTTDPEVPFTQYVQPGQSLELTQIFGDAGLATADPADLVTSLQQANATITQKPGGGFHFQFVQPNSVPAEHAGDITLDGIGRIATVTCTITSTLGGGAVVIGQITIALSGYGSPVQVERPTNVVLIDA